MLYAAKIENGIVVNVQVVRAGYEGDLIIIGPKNTVGIGWIYDGENFIMPEVSD